MDPSVEHLLKNDQLSWIFLSGKGGVGKTTTSCSLAIRFAEVRESVLIISTDPAHNISDSFDQKFSKTPSLVQGFNNLYAMEIDPNMGLSELPEDMLQRDGSYVGDLDFFAMGKHTIKEFMNAFPGIDEAMSFAEVMKLVQDYDYSLVIFDTAPTGHTLRLISFPFVLEESLIKLLALRGQIVGMFSQLATLMGLGDTNLDSLTRKLDELLPVVRKVGQMLKDPNKSTFAVVCISEFLSLYETERLVQQLFRMGIDVNTIFVNQLIQSNNCSFCESRRESQQKYLTQIEQLYEDFHIIKTPLLPFEVRGVQKLKEFSKYLTN